MDRTERLSGAGAEAFANVQAAWSELQLEHWRNVKSRNIPPEFEQRCARQSDEAPDDIIRPNERTGSEMMATKLMRLAALVICSAMGFAAAAAPSPGPWDQPAEALAEQIAGILGPGPVELSIHNLSSTPNSEVGPIRRLIEQDLKEHGVTISAAQTANAIHITLSESARQRVWVAEVVEGDDTQVAMVELPPAKLQQTQSVGGLMLRKEQIIADSGPILAALEVGVSLVVVEPQQIVIYAAAGSGWQAQQRAGIVQRLPLARDPRGILLSTADRAGFEGFLAGVECMGSAPAANQPGSWSVQCHASDDPWTILQAPAQVNGTAPAPVFKAFYNASRDYFVGVVTPGVGVDLPGFYSAALVPRAVGNGAFLIAGVDGKVQLAENGVLATVAGTRDWGSDLAVLRSGCGTGTQVIASGSGEAVSDSLRAYELPALEAVPASAPLVMEGTVTAMWPAPDAKSVFAVVRKANEYEVDRVTALCN